MRFECIIIQQILEWHWCFIGVVPRYNGLLLKSWTVQGRSWYEKAVAMPMATEPVSDVGLVDIGAQPSEFFGLPDYVLARFSNTI